LSSGYSRTSLSTSFAFCMPMATAQYRS
jgi:hypothetical protein